MKKIIAVVVIVMLFGCGNGSSSIEPDFVEILNQKIDSLILNINKNDSVVKVLLIQYYKSGWMDASNGLIDLSNSGIFDNSHVEKIRFIDWRKIESKINSQ